MLARPCQTRFLLPALLSSRGFFAAALIASTMTFSHVASAQQIVASPPPSAATPVASSSPPPFNLSVPPAEILPSDAQLLSLAEAVAAARQNVPSVLSALAQARAAEAQIGLTRTALMPFVTANATAAATGANTNAFGGTSSGCLPGQVCGPYGTASLDGTFSARWALWDFGRTSLNVHAAELNAQSAATDVTAAERLAVTSAATAYYALLADEEATVSARETLTQRLRELEIVRARVHAGANPPVEQTRAEVAVMTARLALSTAQGAVLNDAASLSVALGLDPARPLRAMQPVELPIDDDPAHAADAALTSRPEVQSARLRMQSAEASVAAARAGWRPTLTANAAAGARFTETSLGLTTIGESGSANVVLSVPLYDPTIPANVRIAEANLGSARAFLAQQVLQVRGDAVQAAIGVRTARQQLDDATQNAQLAAVNLEQAEARYRAGAAQLVELVDAQAQDATARLAVIQRRFQFERAKVALLASIGRLSDLSR